MSSKKQNYGKDNANLKRRSSKPVSEKSHILVQQQTRPANVIRRAKLDPRSLPPRDVYQLQCTIGNQAVGRLLGNMVQRYSTKETEARERAESRVSQKHDIDEIIVYKAMVNSGFAGPSRFKFWEDLSAEEQADMNLGAYTPDYVLDEKPADTFVAEPSQSGSEDRKIHSALTSVTSGFNNKKGKYGPNTVVIINLNRMPKLSLEAVGSVIAEKYADAAGVETYVVKSGAVFRLTIVRADHAANADLQAFDRIQAEREEASKPGDVDESAFEGFGIFD